MPLSSGDKLGPYDILPLIGAGGMGEVYKARDTRLDRLVAIKTSKTFSERFEREARAVAALNHPNICQLYDLGTLPERSGDFVMEYIHASPISPGHSPRNLPALPVHTPPPPPPAHPPRYPPPPTNPLNSLL